MNEEIKPNYGHLNGMEPAFSQKSGHVRCVNPEGLTKRELFAAMAMQGILSGLPKAAEYCAATTVNCAICHADALLAELAKPQEVAP